MKGMSKNFDAWLDVRGAVVMPVGQETPQQRLKFQIQKARAAYAASTDVKERVALKQRLRALRLGLKGYKT